MSEFAVGNTVWLCETQEVGLLVNSLGASKWAVQVNGSKRSKVVGEQAMRTLTQSYSLLGSWDDWQAAPMTWEPQKQCFTKEVTIDADTGEGSFKILQEGNWDLCIYPDRHDANLSDGHSVRGPDSGDLNTEWTIQAHGAAAATSYRVRLFLSPQGSPAKVDWVPAQERSAPAGGTATGQSGALAAARRQAHNGDPVAERSVRAEESWAMQCAELAEAKARQSGPKACFEVLLARVAVRSGPSTAAPIVASAKIGWVVAGRPHAVGGESWVLLDLAAMETLMIAPGLKPECGWILADGTHIGLGTILRCTDKSELTTQAVQDAEPSVLGEKMKQDAPPPAPEKQQGQPRQQAREDAAERDGGEGPGKTLCCVCGLRATTDREKADHVRKTGHQGFWMCAEAKQRAPPGERAREQGAGGGGPPRRGGAPQETCVECGMAADMQAGGTEAPCCEHCWKVWQRIRDMGWDPAVVCEGRSAGEYAAWAAEELNLSNLMAREWVMRKFRPKFRARGARATAAGG